MEKYKKNAKIQVELKIALGLMQTLMENIGDEMNKKTDDKLMKLNYLASNIIVQKLENIQILIK